MSGNETSAVLAERIGKLRANAKESQQQLADALSVKRETVKFWESGERQIKGADIAALAKHFKVSSDYLLGLTNCHTKDADLRTVCEYTGLTELSIANIKKCHEDKYIDSRAPFLNDILSHPDFLSLLYEVLTIAEHTATASEFLSIEPSSIPLSDCDTAWLDTCELQRNLKFSVYEALEVFRKLLNNIYGFDVTISLLENFMSDIAHTAAALEKKAAKERAAEVLEQITTGTLLEGIQDGEHKED